MHLVCTISALIYYQSFTNGVHPMCTSSALCVTLSSVSTVDSIISLVSISEISSIYIASVAAQAGLCLAWLQNPKTGFLVTRLNCKTPPEQSD